MNFNTCVFTLFILRRPVLGSELWFHFLKLGLVDLVPGDVCRVLAGT